VHIFICIPSGGANANANTATLPVVTRTGLWTCRWGCSPPPRCPSPGSTPGASAAWSTGGTRPGRETRTTRHNSTLYRLKTSSKEYITAPLGCITRTVWFSRYCRKRSVVRSMLFVDRPLSRVTRSSSCLMFRTHKGVKTTTFSILSSTSQICNMYCTCRAIVFMLCNSELFLRCQIVKSNLSDIGWWHVFALDPACTPWPSQSPLHSQIVLILTYEV